ncbi:MAG: alpha-amylase/alpha-mannosidase [Deltaproteobacteria bacterium]|nr:alpha-amylase/alpha-mannosidase [Deltaproteobacteria bacterium]
MSDSPLNVIFLWHMHQPDYRNDKKELAMMPWVRLHGVKDYLDMVTILDDFPRVRQNFNLVPSLLDQLQGYVDDSLTDRSLELSRKKAEELTVEERIFILQSFFHAHWDNMIKPYPRYWELLRQRGFHPAAGSLAEIQRYFTVQDFLDLQVWYNLVWIDPSFFKEFELLEKLVGSDRNFNETDKNNLLKIQKKILGRIIPAYRERADKQLIELSTTPYYHPILPLLYDTNQATICQPHDPLPNLRFAHPEDAAAQINQAVARHEFYFGKRPTGMWPSEGSVCQEIIPMIAASGIRWIATDEGILANSIGRETSRDQHEIVRDPAFWYRAWQVQEGEQTLNVVFRDHLLSDLIGFVYSRWNETQAADDFVNRLLKIRNAMGGQARDRAVAIILDGENAWEHYPKDGIPFLRELYGRLNDHQELNATTIGDYLERRQEAPPEIKRLYPGSWINRNFRIWIGHQEDNLAWDQLGQARRSLVLAEKKLEGCEDVSEELKLNFKKAWDHIYIAEGSDWCWWYGDDHSSENDAEFDALFRSHLMAVYSFIGEEIPDYLFRPIISSEKTLHPKTEISSFIYPQIDGEISSYFEWQAAAFYDSAQQGGAMHRSEYLAKGLFFGFNQQSFFVRIDIGRKALTLEGYQIELKIIDGHQRRIECQSCWLQDADRLMMIVTENRDADTGRYGEGESSEELEFAAATITEIKLGFARLKVAAGDELNFGITIKHQGQEVQRVPFGGYLHLQVPDADFESRMWYV